MKKCPACAEEILDDAKKCKHCGEILSKFVNKLVKICPNCKSEYEDDGRSSLFYIQRCPKCLSERKQKGVKIGCLTVIGIIVVILLITIISNVFPKFKIGDRVVVTNEKVEETGLFDKGIWIRLHEPIENGEEATIKDWQGGSRYYIESDSGRTIWIFDDGLRKK